MNGRHFWYISIENVPKSWLHWIANHGHSDSSSRINDFTFHIIYTKPFEYPLTRTPAELKLFYLLRRGSNVLRALFLNYVLRIDDKWQITFKSQKCIKLQLIFNFETKPNHLVLLCILDILVFNSEAFE